jgi:hypothetical protein
MKRRIPLDRLEGAVILLVALISFLAMDAFLHQRPPHAGDWLIAAAGGLLAALLPALGPLSRGFRR